MRNDKLVQAALLGKSDYIPLIIKLPAPDNYTNWQCMENPENTLKRDIEKFEQLKDIPSDFICHTESNFLEIIVPALFGAVPHEAPGGLIDTCPIFNSIEETENLTVPDLMGGVTPQVIEHLEYLKSNKPDWMQVQMTRMISPLDAAVVMRGGDFYMDLLLEPELSAHFLDVITDTTIALIKLLKNVLDQDICENLTVRGLYFNGLRLTSDAIVNLSPKTIEEICFPYLEKLKKEFGNIMLHYCCTPAPSGHVITKLIENDLVCAVDNWQGYETFFKSESDYLQDKITICTDLNYKDVLNFDEFIKDKPFFKDVKRKGGRGLTITTVAPSEKKAKELWALWQKRFEKEIAEFQNK